MRIAISAESNHGLDSPISQHFGRCPYFILIDLNGQEIEAVSGIENPYWSNHTPGQVPAFIHQQRASVMLTGGMGRRAISFFQQYDIQPVTGASGTVAQTLQRYLNGDLQNASPCADSEHHHHGHHHHQD
jgi:predicted Fe-Mo cluster-binding NifX family protein